MIIRFIDTKKEEAEFEKNNSLPKFSYESYKFNEIGTLDPKEVNLGSYIPLNESDSFFLNENTEMLNQAMELTFISTFDYDYFIDNTCFSCDFNVSDHYYFFGKDKSYLPFYLKINKTWDIAEWYILKDFAVPTVNVKKVSSIIIVDSLAPSQLLSNSLETFDLRRIETGNAVTITDSKIIWNYIDKYINKAYVFNEKDEEIAAVKEKHDCGYVLASFEGSSLLQCIGTF